MPHVYKTVRTVKESDFEKAVEKLEDQGFTLLNSGYAVWIAGDDSTMGHGGSILEIGSSPQWWAILRKPK